MTKQELLFVQVPKTAGTSFKVAIANNRGKENVVCDYGQSAKETSEVVQEYIYEKHDFFKFKKQLFQKEHFCLIGHFP